MRISLHVEVPDEFLEKRARAFDADSPALTARGLFRGRMEDIAKDELPLALWGWPICITVEGP